MIRKTRLFFLDSSSTTSAVYIHNLWPEEVGTGNYIPGTVYCIPFLGHVRLLRLLEVHLAHTLLMLHNIINNILFSFGSGTRIKILKSLKNLLK